MSNRNGTKRDYNTNTLIFATIIMLVFLIFPLTIIVMQHKQQTVENADSLKQEEYWKSCIRVGGTCKAAGTCNSNEEGDQGQMDCTGTQTTCCVPF
jgi:ABC-type sulfate transport system permease component